MKTIMSVLIILVIAAYGYAAEATYVAPGKMVDYTPSADVSAGDIVIQSGMVGAATTAIDSNNLGAIAVEGVFDIVQVAAIVAAGTPMYWDTDGSPYGGTVSNGAATATSTGNTFIGFALEASTATDSTVRLVLNSSIVSASSAGTFTVGTLAVQTNATVGGTLAVTGVGTFTAESVHNGGVDTDYVTTDAGDGVDTKSGGDLPIGAATATSISIGDTGVYTTNQGPFVASEDIDSDELDAETATALLLGKATATRVELADAAIITDIEGPVVLSEEVNIVGTALSVTNLQPVTVAQGCYVLSGTGSANNGTNTITLAAPNAAGDLVYLLVATASSNLIAIADSGTVALSAALELDGDDTAVLMAVDGSTWGLLSTSDN